MLELAYNPQFMLSRATSKSNFSQKLRHFLHEVLKNCNLGQFWNIHNYTLFTLYNYAIGLFNTCASIGFLQQVRAAYYLIFERDKMSRYTLKFEQHDTLT